MADIRDLLAIGLGALLGLAAIAYPRVFLRVQTAGTRPDRRDEYGGDTASDRAVLLVRLLGVAALLVAGVVAVQSF